MTMAECIDNITLDNITPSCTLECIAISHDRVKGLHYRTILLVM